MTARVVLSAGLALFAVGWRPASADPFKNLFRPRGQQVEADPSKSYTLSENHGPWLVLAATFRESDAEQRAHDLALELRSRYKLLAYTHDRTFDYTRSEQGMGVNKFGDPRRMVYANRTEMREFAVLVGDFPAVDDARAQQTLKRIKDSRPTSVKDLEAADGEQAAKLNPLTRFRNQLRQTNDTKLSDKLSYFNLKGNKGMLANAFLVPNPKLPPEYFRRTGIDKLVYEMNKDAPHSLLKCAGRYTVVVATFRGSATVDQKEVGQAAGKLKPEEKLTRLEAAAMDAQRLCEYLISQRVDAYVFHDRNTSMVCVGSFQEVAGPGPGGKVAYLPAVQQVIDTYGVVPIKAPSPPRAASAPRAAGPNAAIAPPPIARPSLPGYHSPREFGTPKSVKVGKQTLVFDLEPLPVEVPRYSVGMAYERTATR